MIAKLEAISVEINALVDKLSAPHVIAPVARSLRAQLKAKREEYDKVSAQIPVQELIAHYQKVGEGK